MRRYLVNYNENFNRNTDYDVVIIGAGIAGLYTALMLPKDLKIVILNKRDIYDSDSCLAQGGIAASIGDDNRELHVKDTINAGCYINNIDAVKVLVEESEINIKNLIELGVDFDKNSKGGFYRSLEGNHSFPRILHVNGDATGKGIMDVLIKQVENAENIKVMNNTFCIDIIDTNGKYNGITAFVENSLTYFESGFCVMASGGIGQIFSKTTNVDVLTGDGIAMALRAGINLANMQYVQFHPTAFYSKNSQDRMFLISEAVRGEGAVLRNINNEKFMKNYDDRKDLAPRDIVARAINDQMNRFHSDYVYLDSTMHDKKFLKNRFGTIYNQCNNVGIEIDKDYIPVAPAQHYFMGGIEVDLHGITNMENLYAVGECSCTGVHGANRLASNSLMEALVFGRRVAESISNKTGIYEYKNEEIHKFCDRNIEYKDIYMDINHEKKYLKEFMDKNVGIIRSVHKLGFALEYMIKKLDKMENVNFSTVDYMELYNMYQVSYIVILAALESKFSIGSNYVKEYDKNNVI